MTLKEIRLNANLNQSDIAEMLKTNVPVISNYEKGISFPDLEDVFILENKFGQRIDFNEPLSPLQKHTVVQALISLAENYPLEIVLEAGARWYRRHEAPENMIQHYGNLAAKNEEEPLLLNSY